jgi:hypothetical protein
MIPNPRNATRIETFSFIQEDAAATVRIRYDELDAGQAKWGSFAGTPRVSGREQCLRSTTSAMPGK